MFLIVLLVYMALYNYTLFCIVAHSNLYQSKKTVVQTDPGSHHGVPHTVLYNCSHIYQSTRTVVQTDPGIHHVVDPIVLYNYSQMCLIQDLKSNVSIVHLHHNHII